MPKSRYGVSSGEPKQYLGQLRQMLASASSDRDETWDLTTFPEIQGTDYQLHVSPNASSGEEEATEVSGDQDESDSPRQCAVETESVEDRDPESTQDATFPPKDEVAYTLIEDLDERVQEIEEQFKKQATFNDGVQRTMRTVPHEIHALQTDIRALKAKNDKLEGLLNQVCKKEGILATQPKAVRTKRSAT
ncbi:hypothetical protein N7510_002651 [Penicillium lagena]|uniref:uncharacterized protein n=1 Tax=Penicillium lagena TaxID=94218 RepID=UPI002541C45B|nr:uncharacterized protein N7510_002651 [Penicillium lagena]KAJ5626342.1 hypothetical protein N7510_002651 [Penicillium lagena]